MVSSPSVLDRINSALAFYGDGYSGPPVSVSAFCATAGVSRANLYQTYPHFVAEILKRRNSCRSSNQDNCTNKVATECDLKAEISLLNDRIGALIIVCLENATVIDDLRVRLSAYEKKRRAK